MQFRKFLLASMKATEHIKFDLSPSFWYGVKISTVMTQQQT
jgi:hypothetical protein